MQACSVNNKCNPNWPSWTDISGHRNCDVYAVSFFPRHSKKLNKLENIFSSVQCGVPHADMVVDGIVPGETLKDTEEMAFLHQTALNVVAHHESY